MSDIVEYKKKLNAKQERFCQEYIISLNATQSYKKVYKCAQKSAEVRGPTLLGHVMVKARIADLQARIAEKKEITAERVIEELARLSFSNLKSFTGQSNTIEDISKLPDEITAAVQSIQVGGRGKIKLKLHDKRASLESLGRHLGIFERDNRQQAESLADFLRILKDD